LYTDNTDVASVTTTAKTGSVTLSVDDLTHGDYHVRAFVNSNNADTYTLNVLTTQSVDLNLSASGDIDIDIDPVIVEEGDDEEEEEEEIIEDPITEDPIIEDPIIEEPIIEEPIIEEPIIEEPIEVQPEDPNYVCVPINPTCMSIVERLHAGPDDWESIEGSALKYID